LQNSYAQTEVKTFTDFEKAKGYAVENNQGILDRLNDRLVVLYLDFPAKRKNRLSKEQTAHNEALAERFNKSGAFPKLMSKCGSISLLKQLIFFE